jgi:hypothetical protein
MALPYHAVVHKSKETALCVDNFKARVLILVLLPLYYTTSVNTKQYTASSEAVYCLVHNRST